MTLPHLKSHPTLRSYSHVTIQICHISLTTTPMAPKLSRMSNWLRGHHAQSEITLLFRGHVTKTLYLSRYIFSLSHGPWSVTLAKDDRTHLKIYNVTLSLLDKLKTLSIFLVQSDLNWFFTLIFCISPVHKPTR